MDLVQNLKELLNKITVFFTYINKDVTHIKKIVFHLIKRI
jgi:hypothetical protein